MSGLLFLPLWALLLELLVKKAACLAFLFQIRANCSFRLPTAALVALTLPRLRGAVVYLRPTASSPRYSLRAQDLRLRLVPLPSL